MYLTMQLAYGRGNASSVSPRRARQLMWTKAVSLEVSNPRPNPNLQRGCKDRRWDSPPMQTIKMPRWTWIRIEEGPDKSLVWHRASESYFELNEMLEGWNMHACHRVMIVISRGSPSFGTPQEFFVTTEIRV